MYIAFSGNIGSGKSSVARAVAKSLGLHLVNEPVDGNPYLEKFYSDPRRWAFNLQIFNLLDRRDSIAGAPSVPGFVLDRSFEEDPVYVQVAVDSGFEDLEDASVYSRLHRFMSGTLPIPDLMVYLFAETPVLLARIASRGRSIEAGVDAAYLDMLAECYDAWIRQYSGPKIILDSTNASVSELTEFVVEHACPKPSA